MYGVLVFRRSQGRNHRFKELNIVLHIDNSPFQRPKSVAHRRIGLLRLIDGIEGCLNTGEHSSQNREDSDCVHNLREQGTGLRGLARREGSSRQIFVVKGYNLGYGRIIDGGKVTCVV